MGGKNRFVDLDLGCRVDNKGVLECLLPREPGWMALAEELARRLPVVIDLLLLTLSDNGVSDSLDIDTIFIGKFRESIERALGLLISLLIAKDVVNPCTQVLRYIVRLKGFPQVCHERGRISLRPRRKHYVVHALPGLLLPEVHLVGIEEEIGAEVEFRDELAHICVVVQGPEE